jgi:flagellum-specific ATP synthase
LDTLLKLDKYKKVLDQNTLAKDVGKITRVVGSLLEGYLPGASVGSQCYVYTSSKKAILAEVVGFKDQKALMMPFYEIQGVGLGSKIILDKQVSTIKVGKEILGRVLNGLGQEIDGKGPLDAHEEIDIYRKSVNPLNRRPIEAPLDLGVRAINSLLTVGQGQRIGIMAGSGVGKSVLLGQMARNTKADVNVIALIGERGREVREFIENDLGAEGLSRSVIVCATSDENPLMRMRGAFVATAIAEYFSDMGLNVLFMMDSVTRFAMAQREIGLNIGEPATTKGYTPSVFALLPKLLERMGSFESGSSITGLYTVLVEGDDMDDPIADSVRSIVDGHIVLTRKLAHRGHFPAIDILQSSSRVMRKVISPEFMEYAQKFKELLATYTEAEDLINIGAYKTGASPKIDRAIRLHDKMEDFLKQKIEEAASFNDSMYGMIDLLNGG